MDGKLTMNFTPVRQATYAPQLHIVVERAPLKTNDVVIERLPSGMLRKARVVTCFWDETMGAKGEWTVYLKFHPMMQILPGEWMQDISTVMFTWTNSKVCEKVGE